MNKITVLIVTCDQCNNIIRPRPHGYDIFESATFSFRIQKNLRPHLRNQIEFSCPHEYDGIRIYSST